MIVTPRFVFLHLHKSGGTFVNAGLVRYVPGARQVGYHLPRHMIPAESAALPVLGLVRNPWSYYVSWHAFQTSRPQPNALYRVLSERGRLGFAATIRNMSMLGSDDELLQRVLAALPAAYANQGLNLPAFALAQIRGSGLGFYSFLYRYLYGAHGEPVVMGKMERLREDLPSMLEQVQQPVSADLRAYIEQAPPLNTSEHGSYVDHYDSTLAGLVAQRDATVIGKHGYAFG
jgi:hypothetical protein